MKWISMLIMALFLTSLNVHAVSNEPVLKRQVQVKVKNNKVNSNRVFPRENWRVKNNKPNSRVDWKFQSKPSTVVPKNK